MEIIRRYFTMESVDFAGDHYRINHMEALPRCVQRPNPPILVGAGGPRMLDLAGRTADIVGIHARMGGDVIDQAAAVADLTSASIRPRSSGSGPSRNPTTVFIGPWNLVTEIIEQTAYIREWGGKWIVPIPK